MVQDDHLFSLKKANDDISDLCDQVENWQALTHLIIGYHNDPVDVDKDGCFV